MTADAIAVAREIVDILERLEIPYAIGGSVAGTVFGEPRTTDDVDVAVRLEEGRVDSLIAALEGAYHVDPPAVRDAVRRRTSFNVFHLERMQKVDLFVLGEGTLDLEQLRRRRKEPLADPSGRPVYVTSPEDLILRKLDWYRRGGGTSDRQWRDILGLLKVQAGSLDLGHLRDVAGQVDLKPLLDRAFREAGAELS